MTYEYDGAGNLVKRTDPRSVSATYTLDNINRTTSVTYSDSTPGVSYVWDTVRTGSLSSVSNANSTTRYTQFDAAGRVTKQEQETAGLRAYPFEYIYNAAGMVEVATLPSGRKLKTCYDVSGSPSQVSGSTDGGGNWSSYGSGATYTPAGQLKGLTIGSTMIYAAAIMRNITS